MLLHPGEGISENDRTTGTNGMVRSHTDGTQASLVRATSNGEAPRAGSFRFHLDTQRWEWSDGAARLHGYEPGTVTPTPELILKHQHPDDRPYAAAVVDKAMSGDSFSSRHRIVDTAGRRHWVVVVGDQILDDAGEIVGTSGFYIDLTDTMQSEISAAVSEVAASRAEIEQAKGLLIAAYGVGADQAFDILVWRSQETNIKVRQVARRLIAATAGTLPADTRRHIDSILLGIS